MQQTRIFGGSGKVRIGASLWKARGPNVPAGTRVRVVEPEDERS